MNYTVLRTEIASDPLGIGYASLSDEEVAAALALKNRVQTYSRFCSLRAVATVLTAEEYGVFKLDIAAVSAMSPMAADMVRFLEMPCSDDGATGGLDIGDPSVRAFIDMLPTLSADAKAKIKSLAERLISRAEEIGIPEPTAHEVHIARNAE